MRAQTVGRVLGIGLRVAGRLAGQRVSQPARRNPSPVTVAGVDGPGTGRINARQLGRASAGAARGFGGFFRTLRHVGGIVMLEVTGVFFFLFVLVFGNWAWKLHAQYLQGPDHSRFLVYVGLTLVFLYLAVSSFWRARRK